MRVGPRRTQRVSTGVAGGKFASETRLDRAAHDLLQGWVGNQKILEQAWPCRIGAGQLRRRRCPIGFGIADVGRHTRQQFVGCAKHGIEALEGMIAVEVVAELVLELDVGEIEAPPEREGQAVRHVERVHEIEAIVMGADQEIDRRHFHVAFVEIGIERLVDDDAKPGDDERARVEHAQLTLRLHTARGRHQCWRRRAIGWVG